MKKIYLVVLDWHTNDGEDVDIEAFDTYDKALNHFKQRIAEEKTDIDWIRDAFDADGNVSSDVILDEYYGAAQREGECWWDIANREDYGLRDHLYLRVIEIG